MRNEELGGGQAGRWWTGRHECPDFEPPRCGGRKRPPYGPGKHGGQPGNATPVVHRRGGFHIRPVCGGTEFRGRNKSRPYGKILCFRQTERLRCLPRFAGEGHAPPLHAVRERPAKWDCRGRPGERRAGCPHPAGPRGGRNVPGFEFQRCGGRERPPYGTGETRRPPGKMQPPRPLQTHVGDNARIVPGCLRRRRVPRAG